MCFHDGSGTDGIGAFFLPSGLYIKVRTTAGKGRR